jgi:hypothetical protein
MQFKTTSLLTLVSLTAGTILAGTSCSKSNSGSNSGSQMSATVGTTPFQTTNTVAVLFQGYGGFEVIGYTIKSGDSTVLDLNFNLPFRLNMPFSSDTTNSEVDYYDTKNGIDYVGGPFGNGRSIFTITSWDSTNHKISGTVNGVLYNTTSGTDSLILTNGTFSTAYTPEP